MACGEVSGNVAMYLHPVQIELVLLGDLSVCFINLKACLRL